MTSSIRRGGFGRPVVHVPGVPARSIGIWLVLWLAAAAPTVSAHGGVATLQLGAERVGPGGTIEVFGDMTTEGQVALTLIAASDGAARALATLATADDGHFQAFLELPADLSGGIYSVTAGNGVDLASAPLVIAGPAAAGEEGQLPGQDEAFAGGGSAIPAATAPAPAVIPPQTLIPASPSPPVDGPLAVLVVLLALGLALAIGAVARFRAARAGRP